MSDRRTPTAVFTVAEAAPRLRMSKDKLYRLVREGKVPHRKSEGTVLLTDVDIADYLAACYRPVIGGVR